MDVIVYDLFDRQYAICIHCTKYLFYFATSICRIFRQKINNLFSRFECALGVERISGKSLIYYILSVPKCIKICTARYCKGLQYTYEMEYRFAVNFGTPGIQGVLFNAHATYLCFAIIFFSLLI